VSIVIDLLQALGVGGSVLAAAGLLAAALYAYKAGGILKIGAQVAASGLFYVVVVAVATALAILAGWIDPNPGAFFAFVGDVVDAVLGFVADRLSGVMG
jgi:hypothetical protein